MKNKLVFAFSAVMACGLVLTACQPAEDNSKKFTYNTYLSTKPKTWNTHNWQTSDEGYIQGFSEMGFYDVILNSTKDGYEFVHEMAADFPLDTTKEISDEDYDKYGYTGNITSGFVWDIALNDKAVWEDGTPIKADDYIESLKRQLDPKMVNFRADSFYASNLVVANAEAYFKQGRETVEPLYNYIDKDTGDFNQDGVCGDGNMYINLGRYTPYVDTVFGNADNSSTFYTVLNNRSGTVGDAGELAAQRITDGVKYYLWQYVDHTDSEFAKDWEEVEKLNDIKEEMMNYDNLEIGLFDENEVLTRRELGNSDINTYVPYSMSALQKDLQTFVAAVGRGGATSKPWSWKLPLFGNVYNSDTMEWDNVGISKVDDYKIRLFLSQKISSLNLKFALSSNWLVKVDLYDSLKTVLATGLEATKYATESVNNYMSYGAYKLTKFEAGKSFTLERNDNWYGYSDEAHKGQYQMTAINTSIITEHTTVRQMFEKGQLDDFAMNRDDMKDYGNSSRKTTTYESYTQKISFNSDRSKLLSRQKGNENKTIIANDSFRKAISLGLNRNDFASKATAGSKGFTGLLNDLYLTDVELGEMYRNTAQGKSVYTSVYGEYGGDPFAENYEPTALELKQNGYNKQYAVYELTKAIKEELASTEEGAFRAGNEINVELRVYDNESLTTKDMVNFIQTTFTSLMDAAVEKLTDEGVTGLTGTKLTLSTVKDEDYYNTAKNGNYDMIFSTWGGAAINPYGLMQVYCDSTFDSTCEYGFKGKQNNVKLDIDLDGDGKNIVTKSFNNWYTYMTTELIEPDRDNPDFDQAKYDKVHNQKLNVLAGLEAGILNRFEAIPLVARGTSSLTSFKVENATNNYINLVGYGGIRFLEFKMNDAEWQEFITNANYSADLYKN